MLDLGRPSRLWADRGAKFERCHTLCAVAKGTPIQDANARKSRSGSQ